MAAARGQATADGALSARALSELRNGQYSQAERDFSEITQGDPANISAQVYLGQTLFREKKYSDAVRPFEKALSLEISGKALSLDQHRILIDQLAMAYGIEGQPRRARDLLETAVARDPEYPLNYYNLACVFAESGDKGRMLANLTLAFRYKDHVLKGERMPDPRLDSSFQKYVRDTDFVKLMNELSYK